MIRWKYLVPRLSVVAVILLFLALGLDPLTRLGIEQLGTRAIGARVELGEADLVAGKLDVVLRQLAVTNPADPMANLVEIREARWDIDARELLHGRWNVREGVLEGVRFSTPRSESGAIDDPLEPPSETDGEAVCLDRVLAWLKAGGERLQSDLEQELHSPRLCRELRQRWPEEYRAIEARCDGLRRRVERLRAASGELREGRMPTDAAVYARLAEDLQAVRGELEEIPAEVQRLADQLDEDRRAIDEARKHDVAYARDQLRMEELDREGLTRYLLGQEQARRLEQVVAWVEWTRKCLPVKRNAGRPDRSLGRTFHFAASQRSADWVFEHLAIDGEMRSGDATVPFVGAIDGLTTQQAAYGEPLQVSLHTRGESPVTVEAVFDRRQGVPVDQIVVRCPCWRVPARQLGNPDRLGVEIASGTADVDVQLRLVGDELSGYLAVSQPAAAIQARLAEGPSSERLQLRLNQALAGVQGMDVRLELAGTLRSPRCGLQSSLGRDLTAGLNRALADELQVQVDRVVARIDAQVEQEFGQLEQLVRDKSREIADRIELPREQVERVAQSLPVSRSLPEAIRSPKWLRTGQATAPEWLLR
jgi:uncharacterized protein (TIGR03545 family)